jgi:hypothetical protein
MRDLAMLNLAIDSNLRGCDVVALKVPLVGCHEQPWRHSQTEGLGRLEVDGRFELGRRLHRRVGRFVSA